MENHPIPQDVTGFQFKLIGSMTLKQFGYVAVGGVIAFIFFLNIKNFLIKWPLVLLFGGSGAALAFLPYEGRPLDVMVVHFFKALFAPTQYMYEKMGGHLALSLINLQPITAQLATKAGTNKQPSGQHYSTDELKKNKQLQTYLSQMQHTDTSTLDKKETDRLASFASLTTPITQPVLQPVLQPVQAPLPVPAVSQPRIMQPTSVAVIQTLPVTQAPVVAKQTTKGQLADIVSQKKQLETELMSLKEELAKHRQQSSPTQAISPVVPVVQTANSQPPAQHEDTNPAPLPQPTPLQPARRTQAPRIAPEKPASGVFSGLPTAATPASRMARPTTFARNLTKPEAASAGLPTTPDSPNIVVGLVKDPRGNALANLLVEIRDKDDNPIRAFKTNLLGQFASATPLANGVYTIVFEDPKGEHNISPLKIEAKGEVMMPFEVISVDARELLRQELFG